MGLGMTTYIHTLLYTTSTAVRTPLGDHIYEMEVTVSRVKCTPREEVNIT